MSPDSARIMLAFQYAEARATGELSRSDSAMARSHSSAASMARPAMNRAAARVTESRMPSSLAERRPREVVELGLGAGDRALQLALLAPDPAQRGRGLERGAGVGRVVQEQPGRPGCGRVVAQGVEGGRLDVARADDRRRGRSSGRASRGPRGPARGRWRPRRRPGRAPRGRAAARAGGRPPSPVRRRGTRRSRPAGWPGSGAARCRRGAGRSRSGRGRPPRRRCRPARAGSAPRRREPP